MRHAVQITVVVGLNDEGQVEVTQPQIRAISNDGGLAVALNAVFNASAVASKEQLTSSAVGDTAPRVRSSAELARAVWLADQVKLPRHELDAALAAHNASRVVEVLEWIRGKMAKEPVRSPSGLLWRVLGGR